MEAASSKPEAGVGDGAAGALVGELFREHARTVYGLCLVLLRNAHEAEDATQAAFVSAYESVSRGTAPEQPNAWLLTIARNECLDRLRRRTARPETQLFEEDVQAAGVEEIAARNASIIELRAALNELPANQREAIILHELGGLGYTQVAETLGVSVSAVESLLFRARQRLRERTDTLRVLGGLLILPVGLREGLAKAIPGFPATHSAEVAAGAQTGASGAAGGGGSAAGGAAGGSATMSGGTLGTISVKLASLPLVAKVAAGIVVVAGATSAVAKEVANRPAPRASSAIEAAAFPDQASRTIQGEQLTEPEAVVEEAAAGEAEVESKVPDAVSGPSSGGAPYGAASERSGGPISAGVTSRPSSDQVPDDLSMPGSDTPATQGEQVPTVDAGGAESSGGLPPSALPDPSGPFGSGQGVGSSEGQGGNDPPNDPPSNDPPNTDPPSNDPPNTDPPSNDPPNTDPPSNDPPNTDPPGNDPPNTDPPSNDPPNTDPPGNDPPNTDPPGNDPPNTDPPGNDPPNTDPPGNDPPNTDPPGNDPPNTDPPGNDPPNTDPPGGGGGDPGGNGDSWKKVVICHHPPGHPEVSVTITVGILAAIAHLLHGDSLGPC